MDSNDIFSEIQKLTGKTVPLSIERNPDGSVAKIEYQKEWREGGVKSVEKTTGKGKHAVKTIEYEEDYKDVKLTADEVKKLDAYIAEQTKAE